MTNITEQIKHWLYNGNNKRNIEEITFMNAVQHYRDEYRKAESEYYLALRELSHDEIALAYDTMKIAQRKFIMVLNYAKEKGYTANFADLVQQGVVV